MPKLYERLLARAARDTLRGHMPGHKGVPRLGVPAETIDFTELSDTGDLYDPEPNVIREAEDEAASAAGADFCVYSAGGSTLVIQGMLGAVARRAAEAGHTFRVLAARDAHRACFAALGMLGGEADYIYPEYNNAWNISVGISADALSRALAAREYDAVYVTSPTYYGVMSDIPAISAVCADAGVPLLVDAAHGAHLVGDGCLFGVDRRCEAVFALSAHKTLSSLGGGAFALGNVPHGRAPAVKRAMLESMRLFGSSSPSYAVLASLDLALAEASSADGRAALDCTAERVARLREEAAETPGVRVLGAPHTIHNVGVTALDPCRFVCSFDGADGHAAAAWLERERGVAAEMADARNVVFIMTASDTEETFARLLAALRACAAEFCGASAADVPLPAMPRPERVCGVRRAMFAPSERVPLAGAAGRVAADAIAPYPPGIPVVLPGEKISQKTIAFLCGIGYNVNTEVRVLSSAPETETREEQT